MGSGAADEKTLEQVKMIIRRDLKLGPDIQISDDMPFFQSDVDLDSLDMLLLVTSIEKEFGIKIPSEDVGRRVFENVGTLAAYIQQQMHERSEAESGPGAAPVAAKDPMDQLPHQPPFRFVSRLTNLEPGALAQGIWQLTGDEDFFAGHFPGNPLVPGVLIAEALAQLSGMISTSSGVGGKLAHVDVRFEASVAPPAEIVLQSTLTRSIGSLQSFDVVAVLGETTVARGSLTLSRM
jgi:3-hydroxyacyl-[acyl-carrier-protein] dehydratase